MNGTLNYCFKCAFIQFILTPSSCIMEAMGHRTVNNIKTTRKNNGHQRKRQVETVWRTIGEYDSSFTYRLFRGTLWQPQTGGAKSNTLQLQPSHKGLIHNRELPSAHTHTPSHLPDGLFLSWNLSIQVYTLFMSRAVAILWLWYIWETQVWTYVQTFTGLKTLKTKIQIFEANN